MKGDDGKVKDENLKEDEIMEDTVSEEVSEETGDSFEETPEETAHESEGFSGEEAEPDSGNGKKSFFGKKKKDPKDAQIEELTDRLKRSMAEFDNFRKRTEKEKSAMYSSGAKDIIEKILPVVDNFERGLTSIPEDQKGSAVSEGMEMIYRQLMKTLEEVGVTAIESVGQPFDPNYHNAVMHIDDENLGENVVAMEMLKGYLYKDTVIRHSMVQVAN